VWYHGPTYKKKIEEDIFKRASAMLEQYPVRMSPTEKYDYRMGVIHGMRVQLMICKSYPDPIGEILEQGEV